MQIVAVLEVMWGLRGDKQRRWFRINPFNHSGRRLISIVGHGNFIVTNACPDVVYRAQDRGTPSKKWLAANLGILQPDLVLVCGKVAQETFEPAMVRDWCHIIELPHPAARTWSKRTIAKAKRDVSVIANSTLIRRPPCKHLKS